MTRRRKAAPKAKGRAEDAIAAKTIADLERDFRLMVDVAERIAQAYIERPHDERAPAVSHAALIVGLTSAMLRGENEAGLADLVGAVATLRSVRPSNVVDINTRRAAAPERGA